MHFADVATDLPQDTSIIEDISPEVLESIDNYADEAGYGYSRCSAEDASRGCRMEDSRWFRIPAGSHFTMHHYNEKPRSSNVSGGALIEVVDMDGEGYTINSFLRVYSVVDGDKGYTLSDT